MMVAVPNPSTTQTIFSNNRIPISRTWLHTRTMDPRRTRIFGVDDNWLSPNWDTRRAYTSKVSYPAAGGRSIHREETARKISLKIIVRMFGEEIVTRYIILYSRFAN